MQHVPIIRLLLITAALAFAAIGVWNVAQPTEAVAATGTTSTAVEMTAPARRSVVLEFTFSAVPAEYEIVTNEGPVIKGVAGKGFFKSNSRIRNILPSSGADWTIRVHCKNKTTPMAVRVRAVDADSSQQIGEATFWGEGSVEDVLSLK